MDENMKLIMAEFARINTKLDNIDARMTGLETGMTDLETKMINLEASVDRLDARMTGLETRMTDVESLIKEAEPDKANNRLGMIDLKLDKLQESYEKLDADVRVLSGETASGFYRIKHQIRQLEDQGGTIIKVLEMRNLIPFRE